jgi:hypothetical protein
MVKCNNCGKTGHTTDRCYNIDQTWTQNKKNYHNPKFCRDNNCAICAQSAHLADQLHQAQNKIIEDSIIERLRQQNHDWAKRNNNNSNNNNDNNNINNTSNNRNRTFLAEDDQQDQQQNNNQATDMARIIAQSVAETLKSLNLND